MKGKKGNVQYSSACFLVAVFLSYAVKVGEELGIEFELENGSGLRLIKINLPNNLCSFGRKYNRFFGKIQGVQRKRHHLSCKYLKKYGVNSKSIKLDRQMRWHDQF